MSKKKKEKYVIKQGITGVGMDYNVYNMNLIEMATGFAIGFAGGFLGSYIMFKVTVASIILGVIIGVVFIPVYKKHLQKKRHNALIMQFRDLLDSLSNSFSAGKNTAGAFEDAYNDMAMLYGDKGYITREVKIINDGLINNYVIEDLIADLALRTAIDDIESFAQVFGVCNRLGGNLKKVVSDSRDIINEKIEIEMEINTTISSNKNEINILCIMPFVIVSMMGMLGNESITANTPLNVLVKCVALAMFAGAYYIGKKVTDIKI